MSSYDHPYLMQWQSADPAGKVASISLPLEAT